MHTSGKIYEQLGKIWIIQLIKHSTSSSKVYTSSISKLSLSPTFTPAKPISSLSLEHMTTLYHTTSMPLLMLCLHQGSYPSPPSPLPPQIPYILPPEKLTCIIPVLTYLTISKKSLCIQSYSFIVPTQHHSILTDSFINHYLVVASHFQIILLNSQFLLCSSR